MPIYRDDEVVRSEDAGSNIVSTVVWALTSIIIVGMLVWAIFYSGFFPKVFNQNHKVDINVSAPANR